MGIDACQMTAKFLVLSSFRRSCCYVDLPEQLGARRLDVSRRHTIVGETDGIIGSADLMGETFQDAPVQPQSPAEREAEIRRMLERLDKLG